jgi:hypothetical protein
VSILRELKRHRSAGALPAVAACVAAGFDVIGDILELPE